MRNTPLALGFLLALAGCSMSDDTPPAPAASTAAAAPAKLMVWPDLLERERPAPTTSIRYGDKALQLVDLWLPEGKGPHPTVLMVHGGCWQTEIADRRFMAWISDDLRRRGIAVWNIDYRGVDKEGGGYPGTFQDVGAAIDRLPQEAARLRLDPSRSVVVGHSAGGHLALWAAARDRLPPDSPLRGAAPFVPRSTVSLAGIGDLRGFARLVPVLCGPGILERLAPTSASADVFAQISPAEMPAPAGRVVLVSGVLDRLVPPCAAHDYERALLRRRTAGVERVEIPDAGHFDLVTPGTRAWDEVMSRITAFLPPPP